MADRPDFNEYAVWSNNSQSRGGQKPTVFLIHTNEGDTNADQLAHWMQGDVGVSYHYCVSEDYNDHGVTVCDVVDTDHAAWSVGNANNISINLCFAGSKAAWSRADWLKQSRAIDVAAYIAVQDAKKYGFSTIVVPPPYSAGKPGISDHKWVTQVYGWGTHTDVGDGFPWDVFTAAVAKYANPGTQPPVVPPTPAPAFQHPSNDQMLKDVWDQLRGPEGKGWPQLGQDAQGHNLTVVDALAKLLGK